MGGPKGKSATANQVVAWKKRMGHSVAEAAEVLGVHPRTFARWLAGDTASHPLYRDRFLKEGL